MLNVCREGPNFPGVDKCFCVSRLEEKDVNKDGRYCMKAGESEIM